MKERYYCYVLGAVLDAGLLNKKNFTDFKHDRHLCMSHGGFSVHKNRICHKHQCNAWRICPACIKQGDSEKPELIQHVISLGEICFNGGMTDCQLCEFHHIYGPWAHRNDSKRLTAWPPEERHLLITEDSQIRVVGGVRHRVVPLPTLSGFFEEKEKEKRKIFVDACDRNNHLSDKDRLKLRQRLMTEAFKKI